MSRSSKLRLFRTATADVSLHILLRGQLAYLNESYEIVGIANNTGALEKVKLREGVRVKHISFSRPISIFKDVKSLFQLYLYLRKEKPYIIHSITPKAGLISMLAGFLAGVPVRMHTFTGLIFPSKTGLFQRILIAMDKLICACATSVYPEGNGVKKDLLRYKITNKELRVLAKGNINGINLALYNEGVIPSDIQEEIKDNLGLNGQLTFLFIGRLVTDKGIVETVDAFVKLHKENEHAVLVMVGPAEPELDPLPKNTLATIANHPAIHHVGFQEDVRPYIALSDVLVFPSYREGFPNVPLQCAAFKKAMILSDINGCNEIVKHQESGLLVPTKESNAVYLAMKELESNPDKRVKYGINAYNYVKANFEQQEVWKALQEEYKVQLRKHTTLDV